MKLLSILDLVGHLHPVFVHLPIGILLMACLFQFLVTREKFKDLQPAVGISLFWGMISAIVSCITGFILSRSGDYDEDMVSSHQWLGIGVAVVSIVLYSMTRTTVTASTSRWASIVLVALIAITGHLGGSLTHGAGYLTSALNSSQSKGPAIKPIPNIQEAVIYTSAIQPLFEARCYSCHGPTKMKGKLRLDKQDLIMKGGENGKTVVPGKSDESEMIEKLLLPLTDEKHMPPKEKAQLTQNEIALVHWWIAGGADFNKKFKDLPQTDKIKPVLLALQSGSATDANKVSDLPEKEVAKANDAMVNRLQQEGIVVMKVAQNSNYLSVSFVSAFSTADSIIKLLQPLEPQLVWLNLGNTDIDDADLKEIAKLSNLTRLHLNRTAITDKGLAEIKKLAHLRYINLMGTKVTTQGVQQLKDLKQLQNVYLYQSAVKPSEWLTLQKLFPKVNIDSGGYTVPTLEKDTTEVKYVKP